MSSIFTKIIQGELPSYKIAESEKFYAFLDINPLRKGHTLVVPKVEVDYFFDINDDLIQEYMIFTKRVAKAIEKSVPCLRVGLTVIGLEVPHAHIHLMPINDISDMSFSSTKEKVTADTMIALQRTIVSNFI
jgi:histidine triad (HIT) family protein